MVVNYNDIINAIAKAEDVALYNARSRAIELSNGCKPSAADNEKAIEIESWIQILTRAAATIDEDTCLDDDIIWEIIQNINEQNREVDCDVSRAYSRHASSGGGSNVPYGYVERVLGLYVDNSNPRKPVIRIYVNPATISGDGTQADPFSAIGGGGGAVASVNGQTGVVVLTTTNIAEGTNLYYTNARGIASILTGFSAAAGTVLATDTILQALNKIVGNIANKQDTLVSGTNIKTINGNSLLGGGNLVISGTGDVVGPASSVNDRVVFFDGVTGKLIKDSGLTLSGTNTGDNAVNSLYSGLVSNATHTGDATGATALTLATVNSNVGSFTNANITVNAKGLITAASNGSSGSGDVVGPASSGADKVVLFDGTTGKLIKDSGLTLSGTNTGDNATNTTSNTYADGKVADAINNGTTTIAPSQNAVFDALALLKIEEINLQDIGTALPASTYTFVLEAKYARTINELTVDAGAGTCTLTMNINGTPVTGISAVSVSTTKATYTATAANSIAINDLVTIVTSSNSGLENLQITVKTTRV